MRNYIMSIESKVIKYKNIISVICTGFKDGKVVQSSRNMQWLHKIKRVGFVMTQHTKEFGILTMIKLSLSLRTAEYSCKHHPGWIHQMITLTKHRSVFGHVALGHQVQSLSLVGNALMLFDYNYGASSGQQCVYLEWYENKLWEINSLRKQVQTY